MGGIFAVQAGLSFLGGATSEAEGGVQRFTNRLAEGLGGITTAVFAGTALRDFGNSLKDSENSIGKAFGKFGGHLGAAVAVVGGVTSAINMFDSMIADATGATDREAMAMATLTEATKGLTNSFSTLDEVAKLRIAKEGEEFLGEAPDSASKNFWKTVTDVAVGSIGGGAGNLLPNVGLKEEGTLVTMARFAQRDDQILTQPGDARMVAKARQEFIGALPEDERKDGAGKFEKLLREAAKGGGTATRGKFSGIDVTAKILGGLGIGPQIEELDANESTQFLKDIEKELKKIEENTESQGKGGRRFKECDGGKSENC